MLKKTYNNLTLMDHPRARLRNWVFSIKIDFWCISKPGWSSGQFEPGTSRFICNNLKPPFTPPPPPFPLLQINTREQFCGSKIYKLILLLLHLFPYTARLKEFFVCILQYNNNTAILWERVIQYKIIHIKLFTFYFDFCYLCWHCSKLIFCYWLQFSLT